MNYDLESQLRGLEAIAELARLTHEDESVVEAKIEYVARERGQFKYIGLFGISCRKALV